jgi:hypothetical protein
MAVNLEMNETDPPGKPGWMGESQRTAIAIAKAIIPFLFPSENRIFLIQITGHEQG